MFFDGPQSHPHTQEYSHELKSEDEKIQHLLELFPQYSKQDLENLLQRYHGDMNAASNWLINENNEKNQNSSKKNIKIARFACGNCSTIFSVTLPSDEDHEIISRCPTCEIENVIPTQSLSTSEDSNPKPHYSSWMFFNPPSSNVRAHAGTYSHNGEIRNEDVDKIMELFPECNQVQVEEALRVAHGDVDLACNWILAHNEYPESSGPSVTYYHPPVPVACVVNDRTALIQSSTIRVYCGNCSHLMTIALPTSPIQPGSQLAGQCPDCGMTNIIPLRKMSRAVIF